jgi:hypothetical protein
VFGKLAKRQTRISGAIGASRAPTPNPQRPTSFQRSQVWSLNEACLHRQRMAGDWYISLTSIHLLCLTFISTGHYARKGSTSEPTLLRARDANKDQSYYLSAIPHSSLARTLFPIGELKKTEVRALAERFKLPTASRPESMGICFVGEKRRFSNFIGALNIPFLLRIIN